MKTAGVEKWAGEKGHGFTLIEVLVALVITAMVVTVFFQVLSAGMRLEYISVKRTGDMVQLKQVFGSVIAMDIQDDNFKWSGEHGDGRWTLGIEEVETLKSQLDSDEALQLDSELYRYVFEYENQDGHKWTLVRYVQYEPGFFSEDFRRVHFP